MASTTAVTSARSEGASKPGHTHDHGPPDAWCEACDRDVHAVRPAFYWKLALVGVWLFIPMMVFGYVIIGMGAIGATVLAPLLMFLGISLLSTVHDEALRDPTCPRCRRMVHPLDAKPSSR